MNIELTTKNFDNDELLWLLNQNQNFGFTTDEGTRILCTYEKRKEAEFYYAHNYDKGHRKKYIGAKRKVDFKRLLEVTKEFLEA